MASLTSLPEEVQQTIVGFLENDKAALAALSKVNKVFGRLASPLLWQRVSLKFDLEEARPSENVWRVRKGMNTKKARSTWVKGSAAVKKTHQLFVMAENHPNFLLRIRTLELGETGTYGRIPTLDNATKLLQALVLCQNLESLVFASHLRRFEDDLWSALSPQCLLHLRKLELRNSHLPTLVFLAAAPNLEELTLDAVYNPFVRLLERSIHSDIPHESKIHTLRLKIGCRLSEGAKERLEDYVKSSLRKFSMHSDWLARGFNLGSAVEDFELIGIQFADRFFLGMAAWTGNMRHLRFSHCATSALDLLVCRAFSDIESLTVTAAATESADAFDTLKQLLYDKSTSTKLTKLTWQLSDPGSSIAVASYSGSLDQLSAQWPTLATAAGGPKVAKAILLHWDGTVLGEVNWWIFPNLNIYTNRQTVNLA